MKTGNSLDSQQYPMVYCCNMIEVVINGERHQLWSREHERCVVCGTTEKRHVARGVCERCRNIENGRKANERKRKKKVKGRG